MRRRRRARNEVADDTLEPTPTNWIGITPDPQNYFGFCYEVTNNITGRKYIGKKQYYKAKGRASRRHTNVQSKQWKPQQWSESDWQTYTGSSKDLNKDIRLLGKPNFTFEIVSQHATKAELHYAEIDLQVSADCLRRKLDSGERGYYNKSIAGVKFIPPDYVSEETIAKIQKVFKERGHPMAGKPHPNRGKELPQCAPKQHIATTHHQITDGITTKWFPKEEKIPPGWRRGQTKTGYTNSEYANEKRRQNQKKAHSARMQKLQADYYADQKSCLNCGKPFTYEEYVTQRQRNCSTECKNAWRAKQMRKSRGLE